MVHLFCPVPVARPAETVGSKRQTRHATDYPGHITQNRRTLSERKIPEIIMNQPQEAACEGCGGGGSGVIRGTARRMPRHESICTHDRAS